MAELTRFEESFKRDLRYNGDFTLTLGGDLAQVSGLDNLKQAIFNRLVTVPGTLLHRPGYGVGLKDFLNAPKVLSVQREIFNRIVDQFANDERIDEVTSFGTDDTDSPDQFTIRMGVRARGFGPLQLDFGPFQRTGF